MKRIEYTPGQKVLHWISAAVIIWATLSGFFLATLEPDSTFRATISWLNVSITTTFIPVFALRAVCALSIPKPPFLPMPQAWKIAAALGHVLLYLVTAVVLVSGVLMMEHPISLFGLARLPNPVSDPLWNELFYSIHRHGCVVLFLLAAGHVIFVVRHQRAGRDVLSRMA